MGIIKAASLTGRRSACDGVVKLQCQATPPDGIWQEKTNRNYKNVDANVNCSYIKTMQYEWNSDKATANHAKHGVRFEVIEGFDWETP